MNQETTAVEKKEPKLLEYVPFGAKEKIKLSLQIVRDMVAVKTKSGKTCSDTDALRFMAKCQAMQLNPFDEDCYLIGYDNKDGGATFSIVTAHKLFLKRAELHPEYNGMESGIVLVTENGVEDRVGDFHLPQEKVVGGWARVFFKTRNHPMYRRLSITQRRPAYPSQFWTKDKEAEQIVKCAEADALRSSFPTLLGGLHLREEATVHAEPQKFSSPVFTSTNLILAPAESAELNYVESVRKLCKRDGIEEFDLISMMIIKGLADEGDASLEEVHKRSELNLPVVTERWEEIVKEIKERTEAK